MERGLRRNRLQRPLGSITTITMEIRIIATQWMPLRRNMFYALPSLVTTSFLCTAAFVFALQRRGLVAASRGHRTLSMPWRSDQDAATCDERLRELRWKNRAWLATAETIAG